MTDSTKIIEFFDQAEMRDDWRHQYRRYRMGRVKHQYWLWNRKRSDFVFVDNYDHFILKNCQPGHTVWFGHAGYYLKDIWPEITVVEQLPIVKTFYPEAIICRDRNKLPDVLPDLADNFAVVNNRGDYWVSLDGMTEYATSYTKVMRPGCRFFYSFRDTQIHVNRLTTNLEEHYRNWALSLKDRCGLELVWSSIDFKKQVIDENGIWPCAENPDSLNGNLKFAFVYQGPGWEIKN